MTMEDRLMLLLLSFVMMPACRCEVPFLENHSLEFRTLEGETFTEIITVTDTEEYITTEDGNVVFYDFENRLVVIKHIERNECYVSFLGTEASKGHFSEDDFQQGGEHEVNVETLHNHVDRTSSVQLEILPEVLEEMCADRNVYQTTDTQRITRRGDDEVAALMGCFYVCFSNYDCHYLCYD